MTQPKRKSSGTQGRETPKPKETSTSARTSTSGRQSKRRKIDDDDSSTSPSASSNSETRLVDTVQSGIEDATASSIGTREESPATWDSNEITGPEWDQLVARLGPNLVTELDALIKPGDAYMPEYEIRDELQARYMAARRDIYEYLRTRGLRAANDTNQNDTSASERNLEHQVGQVVVG